MTGCAPGHPEHGLRLRDADGDDLDVRVLRVITALSPASAPTRAACSLRSIRAVASFQSSAAAAW